MIEIVALPLKVYIEPDGEYDEEFAQFVNYDPRCAAKALPPV